MEIFIQDLKIKVAIQDFLIDHFDFFETTFDKIFRELVVRPTQDNQKNYLITLKYYLNYKPFFQFKEQRNTFYKSYTDLE